MLMSDHFSELNVATRTSSASTIKELADQRRTAPKHIANQGDVLRSDAAAPSDDIGALREPLLCPRQILGGAQIRTQFVQLSVRAGRRGLRLKCIGVSAH